MRIKDKIEEIEKCVDVTKLGGNRFDVVVEELSINTKIEELENLYK